jgi:type VI protein secretion system component Hcp
MSTLFLELVTGGRALAGDSRIQGFENLIVLERFSWQTSAQHRSVGSEARTTVSQGHIRIGKFFDRASTALYGYMKELQEIDRATITLVDSTLHDDKPLRMMEMTVARCFVDSMSARASDAGSMMRVTEDLVLSFGSGTLRYYPSQKTTHGREAATTYEIPALRSS